MKKNALISISSIQKSNKDEAIEVLTPGCYYKKMESYYAKYDETEISGMKGTTTSIEIHPNMLSLIREGTTSTKMEFQEQNIYKTIYSTPYGVMELEIQTKELKVNIDDNGGEIYINYNMKISGNKTETTELKINIRTQ